MRLHALVPEGIETTVVVYILYVLLGREHHFSEVILIRYLFFLEIEIYLFDNRVGIYDVQSEKEQNKYPLFNAIIQ